MRRLFVILAILLPALALTACSSGGSRDDNGSEPAGADTTLEPEETAQNATEEATEPAETGPVYFEITGEPDFSYASNAPMWTVLEEGTGFTLTISSGADNPVIEIYNIPYDMETTSYPIGPQGGLGISAVVDLTADEQDRYVSTNGTFTFTEVGDTLAGTFEFTATRATPSDQAEATSPPATPAAGPGDMLTVDGTFSEIDRPSSGG